MSLIPDASPTHVLQTRIEQWRALQIPYARRVLTNSLGYRADCSGFVSMVWGLPCPGLTTRDLRAVTDPVTRNELLAGDCLLWVNAAGGFGHVVLFLAWTDNDNYRGIEQVGAPYNGTVERQIAYPYDGTGHYESRRRC